MQTKSEERRLTEILSPVPYEIRWTIILIEVETVLHGTLVAEELEKKKGSSLSLPFKVENVTILYR